MVSNAAVCMDEKYAPAHLSGCAICVCTFLHFYMKFNGLTKIYIHQVKRIKCVHLLIHYFVSIRVELHVSVAIEMVYVPCNE